MTNLLPMLILLMLENREQLWPTGEFVLTRTELTPPSSGNAQIFWYCVGSTMGFNSRLVIAKPNATFDEIAIDTDSWQDPPNDWSSTFNNNVAQREYLVQGSILGGCGCSWFQLNFAEWLIANTKMGSSIATDFFQTPNFPPQNWYDTSHRTFLLIRILV